MGGVDGEEGLIYETCLITSIKIDTRFLPRSGEKIACKEESTVDE